MFDSKIVPDETIHVRAESSAPVPIRREADQTSYRPFVTPESDVKTSQQPPSQKSSSRGRKGLIVAAIIVGVLIVGAGATYAAYVKGYVRIPFLDALFVPDDVLEVVVSTLTDSASGSVDLHLSFAVEPITEQAKPLFTSQAEGLSPLEKSDIAELKSNIAQIRTAIVLYYDDNQKYPLALDELEGTYIAEVPKDHITYTPENDRLGFLLEGKLTIDGLVRIYSIDGTGKEIDTFPQTDTDAVAAFESYANELFTMLPNELSIGGSAYVFYAPQSAGSGAPDMRGEFSGSYATSGMKFDVAFETRVKNGTMYAQVKTFPSTPFADLSGITGKWISIRDEDVKEISGGYVGYLPASASDLSDTSLDQKDMKRMYTSMLSQMISEGYLSVERKIETTTIGSVEYDKYRIDTKPELFDTAMISFLQNEIGYCKANDCAWEMFGIDANSMDSEDATQQIQLMDESGLTDVFTVIDSVTTLDLYVGRGTKSYIISSSAIFSFPESVTALKEKQARFDLTLTLSDFNTSPDVSIPDETISLDDAFRIVQGYAEDEWLFKKQTEHVETVRSSLAGYVRTHNEYPETLDALIQGSDTPAEVSDISMRSGAVKLAQVNFNGIALDEFTSEPSLDSFDLLLTPASYSLISIPNDVYTGGPFGYKKDGQTYTLTYTIQKPKNPVLITEYMLSDYVEGTNTADPVVSSREAESDRDSDDDGLIGKRELELGTNPTLADTDYDGATDFDEVQNGTDPLDPASNPKAKLGSADTDEDGLTDLDEEKYGTNPRLKDTDLDGYSDKNEIDAGYDPLSLSSVKTFGMRITNTDWITGSSNPKVTLVVFSDFECAHCHQLHESIQAALEEYPDDLRVVFKQYPMVFHINSDTAAEASECAGQQGKFWEMHDTLYDHADELSLQNYKFWAQELGLDQESFDACVDKDASSANVDEDARYGELLGIDGTPTFYINGEQHVGSVDSSELQVMIEAVLVE